ncbi:hypothetical protein EYF80_039797 [Liparis tanakae]|uniref:Uncharacterized protein n=1 Tax=Liparis tanakae TaxID=230148 RepID=A0A4Z2G8X9_9TELE|nr:hypothetical protein EYF80_039797 [Liparis tanakae]
MFINQMNKLKVKSKKRDVEQLTCTGVEQSVTDDAPQQPWCHEKSFSESHLGGSGVLVDALPGLLLLSVAGYTDLLQKGGRTKKVGALGREAPSPRLQLPGADLESAQLFSLGSIVLFHVVCTFKGVVVHHLVLEF